MHRGFHEPAFLTFLHTAQGYDPNTPTDTKGSRPITSAPAAITVCRRQGSVNKGVLLKAQGDEGVEAWPYSMSKPESGVGYHLGLRPVHNGSAMSDPVRSTNEVESDFSGSFQHHGISVGVYTVNTVKKSEGYMAWTLDYTRESDAYDMIGYWRVEQIKNPTLNQVILTEVR